MSSNTVLGIAFLIAGALLTTTAMTTMVPSAFADNKQKAEDDSAAAIADCDDNDVERAGFDCIAIATNDVEIETSEEEPPEEESATLSVCKEVRFAEDISPEDFIFTVTGNGPPFPDEFEGSANCVDVDIGPGEYTVSEVPPSLGGRFLAVSIESGSDCEQDPSNQRRATGEIQAGETQTCTFINSIGD